MQVFSKSKKRLFKFLKKEKIYKKSMSKIKLKNLKNILYTNFILDR